MIFFKNRNFSTNEKTFFFIGFFFILFAGLIYIDKLNGPIIQPDELGYWSHAANILGFSWKNATHGWYSYGYSLLLIPVFFISQNMYFMYKLAIIENAILLILNYILGIKIIFELDDKIKNSVAIGISIISSCYSAYFFQCHLAWSEMFLYAFFMLTLYMCLKFLKTKNLLNTFLFSFCIGFIYIIHNRTIVIFIASLLFFLLLLINRSIKIKNFIIFIFVFLGIFFVNYFIKIELSQIMWNVPNGFTNNSFFSEAHKLNLFCSLSGLVTLCSSFIGKLWYLQISTLGFVLFGFIYIFKKVYIAIKERNIDSYFFFYVFLLLSVLGTLAINSIVMSDIQLSGKNRILIEPVFYGRYSDMITGILIICSLLYLNYNLQKETFYKYIGILLVVTIFISIITFITAKNYYKIYDFKEIIIHICHVPGIIFLNFTKNNILKNFLLSSIISIIISFILFYFIVLFNKYKNNFVVGVFILLFTYTVNFYVFNNAFSFIKNEHKFIQNKYSKLINVINNENINAYWLCNSSYYITLLRSYTRRNSFFVENVDNITDKDFVLLIFDGTSYKIILNGDKYKKILKNKNIDYIHYSNFGKR